MENLSKRVLQVQIDELHTETIVMTDLLAFVPQGKRIHVYNDSWEEIDTFPHESGRPVKAQVVDYLQQKIDEA